MWLSKRIVQETPEFEPATLGTVSIGGEDAAVVTDEPIPDTDVPQFGFDDIRPLKAFLIENMGGFTCSDLWTGNGSVL